MQRLKTGTPPRLLTKSVDFSKMEKQEADNLDYLFEFYPHTTTTKRDCYITYTNARTHEIIKKNAHLSPIFQKRVSGTGPRYCPSIEDKIIRFPDKQAHHIFVEPEGESVEELYPNGISTSLPLEIQKQYIQSIVGFEEAIISKPGYAVEYDCVLPDQLDETLQVKITPGLYLAGQINGTTGYEEAAGQGLLAGINAHLKVHNKEPFILDRTESYIGVMINDLVNMSIDEPYRMFTSRAERRLLLRQDNSFLRLTESAYNLGLINHQLFNDFKHEKNLIEQTLSDIRSGNNSNELLKLFGQNECTKNQLRINTNPHLSDRALNTVHAQLLYEPYLKREEQEIKRRNQYKALSIPHDFTYQDLPGLSKELQQKLIRSKPATIAQAALIPGMTPAALSLLIFKTRHQ